MSAPEPDITEADLHAYVDDRLDPGHRLAVERHLQAHPDDAQRAAAYRAQRTALQAIFSPRLADPLPPSLDVTRLAERRRLPWRLSRWQISQWQPGLVAAIVLLAFLVGGTGGWFLRAATVPAAATGIDILAEEAITSHLVYAADRRRPVELWAAQRNDLAQWVSNRLNRPITPPDLSSQGYHLMGGRLVATSHGPAALFMYDNDHGTRLSLFIRPMATVRTTAIAQVDIGSTDGCAWIDKGVGYTVVAAEPYARLLELSQYARTLIDGTT